MRILIATDTYFPTVGGMPVAIRQLTQGLIKNHEVIIIAPSQTTKTYKEYEGKVVIQRIGSLNIVKEREFRIPLHIFQIVNIIKTFQPDIIHIMSPGIIGDTAIFAAKRLHIPLIGTGHILAENMLSPFHLPPGIEQAVGFALTKYLIATYSKLDNFTTPSPAAKKHFIHNGLKIPITPISNGTNLARFQQLDKKKLEEIKKTYHITEVPHILYLGRMDKEKSVDVLLRAVALLKIPFKLLLIGKGVEQKNLESLVASLKIEDKVQFLGHIPDDDVSALYQLSDVYVMPSDVELQSISTIEAMAAGLPVIAANALALPDLVQDGENGFLFTPGDEKELATKLTRMLEDEKLREQMGKKNIELAKRHDISMVIGDVEQIYKTTIEEKDKEQTK